jgi:hypothetical protein
VLKDKSHDKVNNDRAAEREKREINKVHSYGRGADAKFFAPPFANPEGPVLKPADNTFDHTQIYENSLPSVNTKHGENFSST